jgi:hypothetical protein
MDPQDFSQIATGGVLALLVLREVFSFLRSRAALSPDGRLPACRFEESDAARLHSVGKTIASEDTDGAKRVYFPKHVQRTLDMIAETQRQQAEILRCMRDGIDEMRRRG